MRTLDIGKPLTKVLNPTSMFPIKDPQIMMASKLKVMEDAHLLRTISRVVEKLIKKFLTKIILNLLNLTITKIF
ncbi:hypothetical protein ES705_48961 [subsurface metagenome]